MTLPLLHLYCSSLSTCCIMLLITLPLLIATLQLSYQDVSNWIPPNIDIPVSLETLWCWSLLYFYHVLPLLPLCCCNFFCPSRTAATSIALLHTSALKHCSVTPSHLSPPDIYHHATIIKGSHSCVWSKILCTSRILPLFRSSFNYNSMSPHLFSRGAWALMAQSSLVLTSFFTFAGVAFESKDSLFPFFLGH